MISSMSHISLSFFPEFSNLIIHKVSKLANLKYERHTIICLIQEEQKQDKALSKTVSPSVVTIVIGVERNPKYKQIYVVPTLERSLHFSVPTSSFGEFVNRPYPGLSTNDDSLERLVSHIFVPSTINFMSKNGSIYVNNHSSSLTMNKTGNANNFSDSVRYVP